tara:strand:- start:60 stop:1217 length:1158 start_codon:yes stop_codon:yes gene_type:complete
MINIAGEEKLVMGDSLYVGSLTGAGYAPSRQEYTGKWANTSNQVDIIESENGGVGNLAADSNLSILGSDLTPAAAVPFPTNVQVGSRAEITDTRKMYHSSLSGDNVTTDGSYTVLKYTSDGTFTPTSSFNVEYLVIAGGGSGGRHYYTGGGGAGGYRTATGFGVTAQSYPITVGTGGAAVTTDSTIGNNGLDSVFSTITSIGGGGGGASSAGAGAIGGSGGGSATYTTTQTAGAAGTVGQGNAGAQGYSAGGNPAGSYGGGGGGSGGAATNRTSLTDEAAGGIGTASSITGSSVTRAGGGGGGGYGGSITAAGGSGGGGQGASTTNGIATAGTVNTGSGGGGGDNNNTVQDSGAGGSGIVIIRFLTSGNTYTTSLLSNVWTEEGT